MISSKVWQYFYYLVFITAPLFWSVQIFPDAFSVPWSVFFWLFIICYLTLLTVFLKTSHKIYGSRLYKPVLLFTLVIFISLIDAPDKIRGILESGVYLSSFFVFFSVYNSIKTKESFNKILRHVLIVVCVLAMFVTVSAIAFGDRGRLNAFLLDSINMNLTRTATFFEVYYAVFLYTFLKRQKNIYIVPILIILTAVIALGSRGSIIVYSLMTVACILFVGKFSPRRVLFLTLLSALLIGSLTFSSYVKKAFSRFEPLTRLETTEDYAESFSRFYTGLVGLSIIKEHPLNGVGMGNYLKFYEKGMASVGRIPKPILDFWQRRHLFESTCQPISIGAELGLFAVLIYYLIYCFLISDISRIKKKIEDVKWKTLLTGFQIGLISLLSHDLVAPTFKRYYTWFTFALICSAIRLSQKEGKKRLCPEY